MQTTPRWVGRWLRAARTDAKIPAQEVAAKLGIHGTNLLARERGASISADELPMVLEAYGLTLTDYVKQAKRERSAP
jgi:transcriptional regulator with XRE-family HTH domain